MRDASDGVARGVVGWVPQLTIVAPGRERGRADGTTFYLYDDQRDVANGVDGAADCGPGGATVNDCTDEPDATTQVLSQSVTLALGKLYTLE